MKKIIVLPFVLALVVVFQSCGEKLVVQSNSSISDDQARADLELRVGKTQEVRFFLESVSKSLKPIRIVVSDLSKILKDKDNSKQVNLVVLKRIQKVLDELNNGTVTINNDGSWYMERKIDLLEISKDQSCPSVTIGISGQRKEDFEEASIYMYDCNSGLRNDIATLNVFDKNNIHMNFTESLEDKLLDVNETASIGKNCNVEIKSKNVIMKCKNLVSESENHHLALSPFEISYVNHTLSSNIGVNFSATGSSNLLNFNYHFKN